MRDREFVLHLDTPRVCPPFADWGIKGWIASQAPVRRVTLSRPGETVEMTLVERPDVARVMHDFPVTTGFIGSGHPHLISDRQLVFHVDLGDQVIDAPVPLLPAVLEPSDPLPARPAADTRLKQEKLARIAGQLACPGCRRPVRSDTPACPACGAGFIFSPGQLDFLTPAQRRSIPAPDATPASRGGFDEAAYAIIKRYADGLILDCGAGHKEGSFPNVINLEIMDYPSTDVRATNEALPFQDGTFDAVFTFSTLEHIRDPFLAAREIVRVLKPGGLLYSIVPLLAPFHGYPNHYFNMTIEGHKQIYGPAIELLYSGVPLSGRPIHALTWILNSWLNGLPPQSREEFLHLRVADLIADPFTLLKKNHVRLLGAEANLELAATTGLIGRKLAAPPADP